MMVPLPYPELPPVNAHAPNHRFTLVGMPNLVLATLGGTRVPC
jgi:hypothetical protein